MAIPTNKIVAITTTVQPRAATGSAFNGLLIIESTGLRPNASRVGEYASLDEVGLDYPTSSAPFLAAQTFFAQQPHPTRLFIGSRFIAPTSGQLLGSADFDASLADFTAIVNGELQLAINGAEQTISAIDLHTATTFAGVAQLLQTAIAAVVAGTTVKFTPSGFLITAPTTGPNSTIGFGEVAPAGTDLAPLLAIRQADGASVTNGSAVESITQSLQALSAASPLWYGFNFTSEIVDADILAAAAWAEANQRIFGFTTNEAAVLDSNSTTDIGSLLDVKGYNYTFWQYDNVVEYASVSWFARAFAVDFTQPNSTITMKFQTEPGITPVPLTLAQSDVLDSKNGNYYSFFGTTALIAEGVMASGQFFDERHGLDWFQNNIQIAVFNAVQTGTKIPQTDKGVARLVHAIEAACADAVNNGFIAEGVWNGNPVGTVQTGDTLASGFYVYGAPVSSQSAASFSARNAPPITVLAIGAGAIHKVNIALNFQS